MINLDRLDAGIAYIDKHPEDWDQRIWFIRGDGGCGTAGCLAGILVLQHGWRPTAWEERDFAPGVQSTSMCRKGTEVREVDDVAMDILGCERSGIYTTADYMDGITEDEEITEGLFASWNTLDDIKVGRDTIAVRQGQPTIYPDLPPPNES